MKISVRKIALGVLLVGAFVLAACGGASGDAASGGLTVGSDGENLAYAPVTLTAKAGEKVSLTFKNNSTALAHNFVLVNGGVDVATAVNDAGSEAGGKDASDCDRDVCGTTPARKGVCNQDLRGRRRCRRRRSRKRRSGIEPASRALCARSSSSVSMGVPALQTSTGQQQECLVSLASPEHWEKQHQQSKYFESSEQHCKTKNPFCLVGQQTVIL